jgi:hypothetical protein
MPFSYDEVWEALEQSVKLQSHYAELLNMHDGGQRMPFADANAWLHRLRKLEKDNEVKNEKIRNSQKS